jgi:hypothetical protein
MRAERLAASLFAALLLCASAALAEGVVGETLTLTEERIDAFTARAGEGLRATPGLGPLAERIHISGSALGTWYDPQPQSQVPSERLSVWDARVFVDADIAEDIGWKERRLANSIGVSFEWEFYRLGRFTDDLGELYLDLQGVGGSSWFNFRLGRFQLPVGENYQRFGKGYQDNPFLSNAVGGAWWWDEGIRIHGTSRDGRVGYVASVTDGQTPREWDEGLDQFTLKIFGKPFPWLLVSSSVLRSGAMGSASDPGQGALWLGETWARPLGSGSPVPSWTDGRIVADAPGRLDDTLYVGADTVITHPAGARLWLSYGTYQIDSGGASVYDRELHTWLAELLLEGRLVSPRFRRFYLALRANGIGTYDRDEGYVLDFRYGQSLGYNMRSLDAYSIAAGWRLLKWVDLKVEYTFQDVELVRGARTALGGADKANYLGAGLGIHF